MARQTRPVSIQVIERGDYLDIEGFGDCKVLNTADCISESLDITRVWAVSPRSQIVTVCLPCEALVNLVELVTDDNPDVEETTQTVHPVSLRRGDTFYFGRSRVTAVTSGRKHPGSVHFITSEGKIYRLSVSPTLRLRRVVTTRKAKPLSFSEFALSTYDKALERLAKAVMDREVSRESVEAKAENDVITTKDVLAPVHPMERSIFKANADHSGVGYRTDFCEEPVLCSNLIDELILARLHYGDLPVTFVNPEDSYSRVGVSGTMIEKVYPQGVTTWGSQTWNMHPKPGSPAEKTPVVSLW